ncbi:hypothetical protein HBHAL_5032 [Halobacillus halophilus DSM 2266]|uniref:Uncharacterized protein n=1 Tax=Halobacillus halophilus (strain ATCC 35676 / DSM 2266 / JCM 20832 / KCTC 3685 / LMG 17431 / NBRC 102448 / NCIMB 2269) TaxID=866895 RepID=I0JT95_HALH3|nr:hypothetical protein HBHAL_5032 [Halobacillus halophilus DSM 2266]
MEGEKCKEFRLTFFLIKKAPVLSGQTLHFNNG